jgi:hypothetical protein
MFDDDVPPARIGAEQFADRARRAFSHRG